MRYISTWYLLLQEQLECKTVEQSVGIILYWKGGDIMKSHVVERLQLSVTRLTVGTATDTNSTQYTADPKSAQYTTDKTKAAY